MNDSQFESNLRALCPATPPAPLEDRIAAGLSAPEPSPAKKDREPLSIRFEQARESLLIRCFHSLGWAIAGAASAVAAIALYPAKPAPVKAEPLTARVSATVSTPSAALESSSTPANSLPAASSAPSDSGQTSDFQAVETTRELISTEEGNELFYRNGTSPMRQVRYLYRERHTWTNPRTGARVDVEVPREDVFLKPVSLQ
jgi:hypothetical protein